ncbi:MAG: type transport system permease protein [Acidimicrobiaceae bacterium]|jgi:ABC-2 type transport system permease protein
MAEVPFVEIHEPGKAPRRVVLEAVLEVGRECDGEQVADDEVSRRHLKLVPSPTGLRVFDLGSSNGTKVNGELITGPTVLEPGDVIRLGKTQITVGPPPQTVVKPATVGPAAAARTTSKPAATTTSRPGTSAPPRRDGEPARPSVSPATGTSTAALADIRSRPSSVVTAVAGRILRSVVQRPLQFVRSVVVAGFFYVVLVGALRQLEPAALERSSASLLLPLLVLLAVSGVSGAPLIAEDMRRGLVDRLLLSSSRRLPVLIGCLLADFVLGAVAAIPAVVLGLVYGLDFRAGLGGVVVIIVLAAAWAAAWGAIWYGVTFRSANPAHGRRAYEVFVLVLFFSPALVPRDAMAGWFDGASRVNPVTYLVEAVRSLQVDGWQGSMLVKAAVAVAIVGAVGIVLAWRAMRAQVTTTMGGRSPKVATPQTAADTEEQKLRQALEAERQARKRAEELLDARGS